MAGIESDRRRWIPFLLGTAIAGVVIWIVMDTRGESSPDGTGSEIHPPSLGGEEEIDASTEVRVPALRIATGSRLVLAETDLPAVGDLAIALELSDEARGDGPRSARIVSATSGRLDAQAIPLPGPGSGLRLDVDRAFLSHGLYLIEVDTADHHPLKLRRYVLEID